MQIWVLTLGGKLGREHATMQRIKVTLQPVNPETGQDAQIADARRGRNRPGRRRSLRSLCRGRPAARRDGGGVGVDRYRVCELYAAGPDGEGSGSGYRLGDRLVLTARHVIVPALAGAGGRLLVRPLGVPGGCLRGWSGRTPTPMPR